MILGDLLALLILGTGTYLVSVYISLYLYSNSLDALPSSVGRTLTLGINLG